MKRSWVLISLDTELSSLLILLSTSSASEQVPSEGSDLLMAVQFGAKQQKYFLCDLLENN